MDMNDLYLWVAEIETEQHAVDWSIIAALQRNKVYKNEENQAVREQFKNEWTRLIREQSQAYFEADLSRSDDQHCDAIAHISDELSKNFGEYLCGGRLRFGTSQKAFNSYLKYVWALKKIAMPPHCPVDGVVLSQLGIGACWTKSDSREEYMEWITAIRKRLQVAEWENEVWLRWRLSNLGS